jgi:hypothetical protein
MLLLDDIVFSSALAQARRLLKQGYDAEKAAKYACRGAWKIYRKRVLDRLLAEQRSDGRECDVSTSQTSTSAPSHVKK